MRQHDWMRWLSPFNLEAHLGVALLALFGYLPAATGTLLLSWLSLLLILTIGAWLYQGGGRSLQLHFLLYPFIAAAGWLAWWQLDSLLIAIAAAGAIFWRVHTIVTIRLYHDDLLRVFTLAAFAWLANLVAQAMIIPLATGHKGTFGPLFGMLALLLLTYVWAGWGLFLSRERHGMDRLPRQTALRLGWELWQAKAALLLLYAAVASLLIFLLSFLWNGVKPLLGAWLTQLAGPLLRWIEAWIEQLAARLARDGEAPPINTGEGTAEEQAGQFAGAQGETLFSQLQPYLVALLVLAAVGWLAWKMWQRRYRPHNQPKTETDRGTAAQITPLDESPSPNLGLKERLQAAWERWFQPVNDPVRQLYRQFLHELAREGLPKRADETSLEYLHRLQAALADPQKAALAAQITEYYQRQRYQNRPLDVEEVSAMEACVKQWQQWFS